MIKSVRCLISSESKAFKSEFAQRKYCMESRNRRCGS